MKNLLKGYELWEDAWRRWPEHTLPITLRNKIVALAFMHQATIGKKASLFLHRHLITLPKR